MRIVHVLLIATFFLTASSPAWGDSKPKTHDGFHFQLTGGLGYYSVSGGEPANQDFKGMTMPGSLLMGGTLFGHMAFGGGMYLDYAPSPTYEVNGTEVADAISSQFILGLGVYGDYYLEPEKNGLHIQVFTSKLWSCFFLQSFPGFT